MNGSRAEKMEVARQFRVAAWRIGREAKEIGVATPPSVKMVLRATDEDFITAQHGGATSPERVAKEIELMERELDDLARLKLGATALRSDTHLMQENQERIDQNSYGVTG